VTPSNLTVMASVREWQKHFNQAFNLSSAAQDVVYSSTQTISGGLIICRNFTVNVGVVLTISNPTTIICQNFINNGTITMSSVAESVLHQYRHSDATRVPTLWRSQDGHTPTQNGTTTFTQQGSGGAGGASYGDGGFSSHVSGTNMAPDGSGAYFRQKSSPGWKSQGMALWWPISYFRNPLLSISGGGGDSTKPNLSCSLAWQTRGGAGARLLNQTAANGGFIYGDNVSVGAGGNPGSFLEVFSRVSSINTGTINAIAANGAAGNNGSGGGGGGGCVGIYAEATLSHTGTINCSGGNSGGNFWGAGGGGGGIFLTAPSIVNSGTNTVSGGTGNTGAQAGGTGVVFAEPYLRLWMPGEDDVIPGTRYQAT